MKNRYPTLIVAITCNLVVGFALGAASTRIHRLTDTVWTVELVGRCSLDYHTAPTRAIALACPGMDYLRLWPWPPVPAAEPGANPSGPDAAWRIEYE
jgi:hypothetical protein